SKNITITVLNVNDPPVIMNNDQFSAYEDSSYNSTYSATDEDIGDSIRWRFDTNASWLTWDEYFLLIKGIPTNAHIGQYWVNITAYDLFSGQDVHNFTVTVVNKPPKITTLEQTSAKGDIPYFVDYNSTDDDQGTITWHLATNATWLTLDPVKGYLTGTPRSSDAGTCWVNVSVDDGNGGRDSSLFTITVMEGVVPKLPPATRLLTPLNGSTSNSMVVTLKWADADGGESFRFYNVYLDKDKTKVEARSGTTIEDNVYLSMEYTTPTLEAGITYYWTVVPEELLGLPGVCQDGIWNFKVADTVIPFNNPPDITGDADYAIVYVGDDLDYVFEGTDPDVGDAANLKWTVEVGLPGMTIENDGTLHWTPNEKDVGNHTVVVRLSDGKDFVEDEFTVTVKSKGGGGGDDGGTSSSLGDFFPLIIILIVIISLVGIAIVAVMTSRRNSAMRKRETDISSTRTPVQGTRKNVAPTTRQSIEQVQVSKKPVTTNAPEVPVKKTPAAQLEEEIDFDDLDK
nr:putative Ig domain-containing protein [Candidatus Sigynarchaeota archaeon]